MLTLITIVIFGLGFAFLATQNTAPAIIHIMGYTWQLPMYLIVFGTLLTGFFIAWIISSINTLSTWSLLHGKDKKIHENSKTMQQFEERIRQLELENAKLQGKNEVLPREKIIEKTVTEDKKPSYLDRVKKSIAY